MKTGEGVLKSDKVDSEGGKIIGDRMTLCNGKQVNPLKGHNNSKLVCSKKINKKNKNTEQQNR